MLCPQFKPLIWILLKLKTVLFTPISHYPFQIMKLMFCLIIWLLKSVLSPQLWLLNVVLHMKGIQMCVRAFWSRGKRLTTVVSQSTLSGCWPSCQMNQSTAEAFAKKFCAIQCHILRHNLNIAYSELDHVGSRIVVIWHVWKASRTSW